jgi:hypothetical protein
MRGRGGARQSPFDRLLQAGVAQLAEQLICNQQVAGSSPIASSSSGEASIGNAKANVEIDWHEDQRATRRSDPSQSGRTGGTKVTANRISDIHIHSAGAFGTRVERAGSRSAARWGCPCARNSRSKGFDELERYRSGQTGQTVNLLAMPSEVRILPSPPRRAPRLGTRLETRPGIRTGIRPGIRTGVRTGSFESLRGRGAPGRADFLRELESSRARRSMNAAGLKTVSGGSARAGIAQLARARAFQARGRGFESRFPLHAPECTGPM